MLFYRKPACNLCTFLAKILDHTEKQYNSLLNTSILIIVTNKSLLKACFAQFIWIDLDIQNATIAAIMIIK